MGSPRPYLEVGASQTSGDLADWDGQMVPFSWLASACDPRALLDGDNDRLALVIHDHYRDSIEAQGRDPGTEPAGRTWEKLGLSYRDASRQQADHLWAKLATTDGRAVPLDQAQGQTFAFAPLEVERLAEVEHRRWAADRYLAGWTYAQAGTTPVVTIPNSSPMGIERAHEGPGPLRGAPGPDPIGPLRPGRAAGPGGWGGGVGLAADHQLQRLADDCLGRLAARFPDRALILATSLGDPAARLLARMALDDYAAALWVLCPTPIPEWLAGRPMPRPAPICWGWWRGPSGASPCLALMDWPTGWDAGPRC